MEFASVVQPAAVQETRKDPIVIPQIMFANVPLPLRHAHHQKRVTVLMVFASVELVVLVLDYRPEVIATLQITFVNVQPL